MTRLFIFAITKSPNGHLKVMIIICNFHNLF